MTSMSAVVDAHCHVSRDWFEPLETLLEQMDRNGVQRSVLVQLLGCYDNRYLLECVQRHPGRLAAVVAVDPADPQALTKLQVLCDSGAVGLRLRPGARSAGEDPLAIWRAAERLQLPVSCVGNAASFCAPEFEALLQAVPRLPVVLEHLGGSSTPDSTPELKSARARVLGLARHEQVYMKVPGLGEFEARAPALHPTVPSVDLDSAASVLHAVLKRFRPDRLMWGSDFPVVSSREGYANALAWTRQVIEQLEAAAVEAIFRTTAASVFQRR